MYYQSDLLGVLVAAIIGLIIGAIWYSPKAFAPAWQRLTGKTMQELQKGSKSAMIWQFVALLVMSFVLASFIGYAGARTASEGIIIGFWAWLGFVAVSGFSDVIFGGKPTKLFMIESGYYLASLLVMGGVLAAWGA